MRTPWAWFIYRRDRKRFWEMHPWVPSAQRRDVLVALNTLGRANRDEIAGVVGRRFASDFSRDMLNLHRAGYIRSLPGWETRRALRTFELTPQGHMEVERG